jgi:hypothetical protein
LLLDEVIGISQSDSVWLSLRLDGVGEVYFGWSECECFGDMISVHIGQLVFFGIACSILFWVFCVPIVSIGVPE